MPTNQYSSFGSWSQCSASCGNGVQTRVAVSLYYLTIIQQTKCSAICGIFVQAIIAVSILL